MFKVKINYENRFESYISGKEIYNAFTKDSRFIDVKEKTGIFGYGLVISNKNDMVKHLEGKADFIEQKVSLDEEDDFISIAIKSFDETEGEIDFDQEISEDLKKKIENNEYTLLPRTFCVYDYVDKKSTIIPITFDLVENSMVQPYLRFNKMLHTETLPKHYE